MSQLVVTRFDRMDENLVKPQAVEYVVVEDPKRGSLDLNRDRAQHRRYASYYSDLQN